jgi:phage regulator Rha-like protein
LDGAAGQSAVQLLTTEVAELTGKRHADVMRDTRNVLSKLDANERSFALVYQDAKGEERPCFRLPERELPVLLTGYSIPLRAKVIDRMRQLEAERRHANVVALPAASGSRMNSYRMGVGVGALHRGSVW